MKKLFIIIIICISMLGGCSGVQVQGTGSESTSAQGTPPESTLAQKFESISFESVSDYFSRNVVQDGADITEMFVIEDNRFVRIAMSDDEEEVFVYDYAGDEFSYLHFFSGELVTKVVYNVGDDKVIEDENDFIDLVKTEAIELKKYFEALIEIADISVEELLKGGEIL